jgi:hypothetical protein
LVGFWVRRGRLHTAASVSITFLYSPQQSMGHVTGRYSGANHAQLAFSFSP